MCDMLNDLREEQDEIELEQYGTIIAAPNVNIYMFCCAKCQDMFRQLEKFIEHIKQEHEKSETNNSLFVPMEVNAINQECGSTSAQWTIASKIITMPQEEKGTTDIASSTLKCNEATGTPEVEISLEYQEPQYNGEKNISVIEEGMEKEFCFEITTKEENAEKLVENSESRVVQSVSAVNQKQFELEGCGAEAPKTLATVQNTEKFRTIKQLLLSKVSAKGVGKTSDLLNTSIKSMCKCCNKSFNSFADLKVHMGISHAFVLDVFRCPICIYTTINRSIYQRHMRCHSLPKQYKCTYCDYKAKRLYDLQRHERGHTGDRGFICLDCQKAFTTASLLSYHMDSHLLKYVKKKEIARC